MCHGNKLGAAGVRRSQFIIFSPSENWQAGALWLENSHKKYYSCNDHHGAIWRWSLLLIN
jgi:hypothetical protein